MRLLLALVVVGSLGVAGCGTDHPFRRGPERAGSLDEIPPDAEVSFSRNVLPALTGCPACHASGAGGWTYTGGGGSFGSVVEQVTTASPAESPLLVKGSGGGGHGGGTIISVSSTEYQVILRWIQEGAQNN